MKKLNLIGLILMLSFSASAFDKKTLEQFKNFQETCRKHQNSEYKPTWLGEEQLKRIEDNCKENDGILERIADRDKKQETPKRPGQHICAQKFYEQQQDIIELRERKRDDIVRAIRETKGVEAVLNRNTWADKYLMIESYPIDPAIDELITCYEKALQDK